MKKSNYDFGGWATKNDLLCADGRTIRRNAFKDDDGRTVPLVYQHNHEDPTRVIGHALLENRDEGVYAYCSLNRTDIAQHIKECVRHGDINGLSIYANRLKQNGGDVVHGVIRELSIVLAGANPGAVIEFPLLAHGEESDTEAFICSGDTDITLGYGMNLRHSDDEDDEEDDEEEDSDDDETIQDVLDSMTDKQRKVVEYLIGRATDNETAEEEDEVSHSDEETIQDVLDSMTDKQLKVVEYLIGEALGQKEDMSHSDDEDDDEEEEEDSDDDETIQDVLDSMTDKQRKVVEYLIGRATDNETAEEEDEVSHSDEETIQDVLDSMTDKQQQVTEYLIGQALESRDDISHADDEEDSDDETIQDVLDSMNDEQRKITEFLVGKALNIGKGDNEDDEDEEVSHADDDSGDGRTVKDILDTMTDKQRKVVEYLIAQALASQDEGEDEDAEDEASHSYDEGENFTMKKNVFDTDSMNDMTSNDVLTHVQQDMILKDGVRLGSLRNSVLEHSGEYGIDQIDYLFPDYKSTETTPTFIQRDQGWVSEVFGGVNHTPFTRVKTLLADITAAQARAKGYITSRLKKTEVFTLLKRTTDPQTIYKYQKLDRDDILDITDFDVVAWMKTEMRMVLNEEIARAVLIGDGRDADAEDHISENHVRSIFRDSDLYAIHKTLVEVQGEDRAKTFIKTVRKAWKEYQGRGNCMAFMTEDMLSDLMLLEDGIGHFLYPTKELVASVLGVNKIVTVPVMAEASTIRTVTQEGQDNKYYMPLAIIVNLKDYNVGADKGGSVNMFEDFDIKYNQNEYLIETRCSGALTRPHSAIVIEVETTVDEDDEEEEP